MTEQNRPRTMPLGVAIALTVFIGVLTAVQARINGQLGAALGDGFVAASISFGSGLVLIVVLTLATPSGRAGLVRLGRGVGGAIPFWMLLGGLAGAVTVATQGLTVATIGVALFTVGLVAGQTAGGLVLDRAGYGPGGVVPVTLPRLVGGLLAIAGVVLCALGQRGEPVVWWMLALPLIAGVGIAWQQGTNGRLRQEVGSPLATTVVNFTGGSIALGIAAVVSVAVNGTPAALPTEPWMYLGGPMGVVYIVISAALVRRTGVLLLGLGSVVGLLAASIVLDAIAPPPSGPSLAAATAAAIVAFIGVVIAVVPWRRRRRA
ncbi:DMT family transporter [Microbacterium imperiale]|uniref:Membrane protein n=1 Tax=Microbacterium imperiale TaxID=33884 RepID=A0A9W6HGQ7_9MICO|nr:DMT family transporter [Microbacterium imperiale]BFE39399.1 DMT family transporter [Microbacterium imperiale]GLJ79734.1 membrane protein [Microbacterium imperiale]